MVTVTLEPG